ncbi:MAG: reverse transcriptase family protein [Candidatus Thiodiazotropha sp.]
MTEEIKYLKILSLNVCGLVTKLKCPEFVSLIQEYDLIGIQETKTDDADSYIDIPGYEIFFQNRENISRYRSGGIALIVKKSLVPFVTVDKQNSSKLVLLFTVSKRIFGSNSNNDLFCGVVYIPPYGSRYASADPYTEIQQEILRYCGDSKYILMFGDFNSRTKDLSDFTEIDGFISDVFGTENLLAENASTYDCFEQNKVPFKRKSADNSVNQYGYSLIDFCKGNNFIILNGRIGNDYVSPKLTCKNKSTVDYFLSSPSVFDFLDDLCVCDFSSLFSDAHSPVSLTLKNVFVHETTNFLTPNKNEKRMLWNAEKSDKFVENFDIFRVSEIEVKLDKILDQNLTTKADIDDIVMDIGNLFETCTNETFGAPKSGIKHEKYAKYDNFKPWFNSTCIRARNLYHKTRKMYNRYKSEYYKNLLKVISKSYKTTLAVQHRKYNDKKICRLRNLRKNNPKEYWKIINSSKTEENPSASLTDFYNFFKNVNAQDDAGCTGYSPNFNINENIESNNDEINKEINENEILAATKSLKNNKSCGLDNILNEHIKSTIHIMIPVYKKLFNLILDTGIVPENWTCGVIKPIFKKKGDPADPSNYRPITLLSCFGKLFTAIINTRLKKYAEISDRINWSQAGFRPGYSTTDNLFILKCLIDFVQASKKKLFCCFVDFKQAFDTVWRIGLWKKLVQENITGKCFKLIFNMYQGIKSKISTNEGSTAFFDCNIGVRQGENLSPVLFTFYLNDLERYLSNRQVNGIECDVLTNDAYVYFKLLVLLYADDTVLFSDNSIDMQHALDIFEEYCKTWRLSVNISKTKIVVFGRGRTPKILKFTFQQNEIEITDEYKYLGIYLGRSGSFVAAKKHIAEQANKALFSLLKKIRCLNLPYDIQIDMFNKMIKPILLYGCEIWGVGNFDVLERIQLKFYKYIFNLKKSTPSYMVYGELGVTPLYIDIQTRIVSFWTKLILNTEKIKLSSMVYTAIYSLQEANQINCQWIENVKNILCSNGFSGVWYSQSFINSSWLIKALKQKLNDIFIQNWSSQVQLTSESNIYKSYKTDFEQGKYISILSPPFCKTFIRFRTRNHRLPIEVGRWGGIPVNQRLCSFCNELGDEFHFLLTCKHFELERKRYLKRYYYVRPNIIKFDQLMNMKKAADLKNLCRFINVISKHIS